MSFVVVPLLSRLNDIPIHIHVTDLNHDLCRVAQWDPRCPSHSILIKLCFLMGIELLLGEEAGFQDYSNMKVRQPDTPFGDECCIRGCGCVEEGV